jgi:hypothetical protein
MGAPEHEPGTAAPRRARRADLPAPAHTQVAAQDEAAIEAQEQVLAHCLDAQEPATVETLGRQLRRGTRMRGLDRHALPDEHLKPTRGSVEGIAFGHFRNQRSRAGATVQSR